MSNLARIWYAKQNKYEIEQILRKAKLIEKINQELKDELSK